MPEAKLFHDHGVCFWLGKENKRTIYNAKTQQVRIIIPQSEARCLTLESLRLCIRARYQKSQPTGMFFDGTKNFYGYILGSVRWTDETYFMSVVEEGDTKNIR